VHTAAPMKIRAMAACALALCLFPALASAHVLEYGTVSTEFNIHGRQIAFKTEASQNINVYGISPEEAKARYEKYFSERIQVKKSGVLCPFTLTSYDPSMESPHSTFSGAFDCPTDIRALNDLSIHSSLFTDAFVNFDHFLIATVGNDRFEISFTATKQNFPAEITAQKLSNTFDYFLTVSADFLSMGMHHIWTGYDHVLFLLSIILLARSTKRILLLVTAFTLAHSITLILAGFDIIVLSSRIVEPAIAGTILYITIRNLQALRSGTDTHVGERIPLTFAFGLIHGLGFAGVLAETSIPQIFFVPALLTFNVGIELGQIAILAVALPVLWYIDTTRYRSPILKMFSYCVGAMALFWIVVRIFL
jgi:hydrogenase/urease accessory protein HupE